MTNEEKEAVKQAVNIVEVIESKIKLRKLGSEDRGLCPFHDEKTPSFTVSPSKQIYKCFGCGRSGDVFTFLEEYENKGFIQVVEDLASQYNIEISEYGKKEYKLPVERLRKVGDNVVKYFKGRGISNNTLLRFGITESKEYMPQIGAEVAAICFNYIREGKCINIKFRGPKKAFKLEKDAELILYNLDGIKDSKTVVVCEGEIDALSCYEAGIYDVTSVPNGAGVKNQNLQYIDNCIEYFENKERIVIFTDNDNPGIALREELIRRLGVERCFIAQYPSGCKDANEILLKRGKEALQQAVSSAIPVPLEGIFTGFDLSDEIFRFYNNGYPNGYKVPMPGMDAYVNLQLMLGHFTVITGIPGHGKSEWTDWLMVLMSMAYGWKWAICSPENQPSTLHAIKIIQKYYGKAFDKRYNTKDRIPIESMFDCVGFLNEHFYFINIDETEMTLDAVLSRFEDLITRQGVKGWLLDPWNKIEFNSQYGANETQSLNMALTKVSAFCKKRLVHGLVVAHPTKMKKDPKTGLFEVPNMYSINGSSHWYNQMDNGITVYRNNKLGLVEVFIQKVRFDWLGNVGFIRYNFNKNTRQYELVDGNNMEGGSNQFPSGKLIPMHDAENGNEEEPMPF